MTEVQRQAAGLLFCPGDPELKEMKLRAHNLCTAYNALYEDDTEKREGILSSLFCELGEGSFIQGPMFIHYGNHTRIGKRFFGNFNLTIQDDGPVVIGDDCNFGPNVTIVTPVHPLLPEERRMMRNQDGEPRRLCYAKPVRIGNNCWFGANVVVCSGVTIGEGCVIGAGSVVVKDIPPHTFAGGNPCRVIRELTSTDSILSRPEVLGGCTLLT
ncbi:MAG: sugar O-acetyltransferase [Christensenellales bacterium]|jgi:acetyltransferase-like isoleucine patch superfamily enzyme